MEKFNTIKLLGLIPLIFILFTSVTPAFAGPVIVDGTDSPDHRGNWPYIQNAIKSLLDQETRTGNFTSDILSLGTLDNGSGGGGAINLAASNLGVTVQHCGGVIAMQACFDGIVDETINPRVLYFPGTGSRNDLDDRPGQGATLTANAQTISNFVGDGGGVLSHGSGNTALGWLKTLLPNVNFPGGCQASGAHRTAEGIEAFPDITDANIRGICHNHFTGDFGGLVVLAVDGRGEAMILGLEGGGDGTIEEGNEKKSNGGDNQWDTRPTFGVSHETRQGLIVENGFSFNTEYFTLTDNHHTDFVEQSVDIGTVNSFSATVWADKGLKIQEFLFGIPNVGESHLAELGVEVWYDNAGEIEDVIVVQKSDVIDADTVSVSHEKVKCLSTDEEVKCDTTTVSMTFLEPLADKVMAIKAIDWKLRDQRTYLNEGFDILGDSLNPMLAKMIPSNIKNQGLLKVTQMAKYSPYWQGEDGQMFEMNSFGSFKQINQSFERFQDTGNAFTRAHSGFGGILAYEQDRATDVFDSSNYISELPESFTYIFPETGQRLTDEILQEMQLQAEIAQSILDEMDRQDRHY